jgi:hypothetical protein
MAKMLAHRSRQVKQAFGRAIHISAAGINQVDALLQGKTQRLFVFAYIKLQPVPAKSYSRNLPPD